MFMPQTKPRQKNNKRNTMINYSDDNCTCQAEQISYDCPRHGHLFDESEFDC